MLADILFAMGTGLLFLGECVWVETRQGKLEVIATDITGRRIPDVEVELCPAGDCTAPLKNQASNTGVLYGEYRLRVYAQGFRSAWRDIRIDQAEAVVRVPLEVGYLGCPPPPLAVGGRIRRGDVKGELWVKAIPVRGTGGGEARVSESGNFLIAGLDYTNYFLMVIHGEDLLHQEVVRVYPRGADFSKLSIDLGIAR